MVPAPRGRLGKVDGLVLSIWFLINFYFVRMGTKRASWFHQAQFVFHET